MKHSFDCSILLIELSSWSVHQGRSISRNLDIIDDDNRLSRNGEELLLVWSAEQQLAGILDDAGSRSHGAKWLRRLIGSVADHVKVDSWPKNSWWDWSELADYLRPDQPGTREKTALFRLLSSDSNVARKRCIELLLSPNILRGYKTLTVTGSRGDLDRTILAQQIDMQVRNGNDDVDRLICYAVSLIESYEQVSGGLESAFRGLMWALTRRGGRSTADDLIGDSTVISHLASVRRKLAVAAKDFQSLMSKLRNHPQALDAINQERLDRLMQDALDGLATERALVDAVMGRHQYVQKQKRKGVWIEQDLPYWTLMPGFGDSSDTPWIHDGAYLHPFRVSNAYSLLTDLGKVPGVEGLMARKTMTSDQPPLSQYWTPPPAEIEGGLGEPWACIASTFEFDAEFFETELLPRFLGLKFDQTENEPSFFVEREEALALTRIAILVDHSRFDPSQTTLRWDQVQIQIPGGIQHAKISVLAWENLIRLMIGSANLKRIAYRRNREMFAALDFWNSPKSTPLRLVRETLDLIPVKLGWSRSSSASVNRTRETIDRMRRTVRSWNAAPADFTPRERPRAALAVTHPRANNQPARSALDEVVHRWGSRRATTVTVVTPFTAPEPDATVGDTVVNRLAAISMTRDCQGWLVVPELPKTPEDQSTRLPFPDVLKKSWQNLFGARGGAYVLSLPLCVEGKEGRNRPFHTKCIVLESDNDDFTSMMIGSSNFTPRGMGVGVYNFEVNLVFEDADSVKHNGFRLIDRLSLPRDWNEGLDVSEVIWQTPGEPPEDEPDSRPALPNFFAWATFSQLTGQLRIGLDRSRSEPKPWSVRLPGAVADVPALFTRQIDVADPPGEALSYILPEAMHAANIVALLVEWQDNNGAMQQAKLGVTIESEDRLLPPEHPQKLNAEAIIECLISGKTPTQWFDQTTRKVRSCGNNDAAIESLRSVDTSSFLLHRVRRFGRALTGMSQRIARTLTHPDAIRYRLLKDPFGPVSLAQCIALATDRVDTGWCAKLDSEHRLFLLAEILLTVAHLHPRVVRRMKGKERQAVEGIFRDAIKQLQRLSDSIATDDSLPMNLRDYLVRVRTLARSTHSSANDVQHVD
jgi:hypothetical protein